MTTRLFLVYQNLEWSNMNRSIQRGLFLYFVGAMLAFSSVAMEKTSITTINIGGEKDPGVRIYRAQGNFFFTFPIYRAALRILFQEANDEGIKYLFLPRFGKIGPAEFAAITFHEFENFCKRIPRPFSN